MRWNLDFLFSFFGGFIVVYPVPAGTQERSAAVQGRFLVFFLTQSVFMQTKHALKRETLHNELS